MLTKYGLLIANILICSAFLILGILLARQAQAQMPGLPYQLYGKVLTNDQKPVQGARVEAMIAGSVVGTSVTNNDGSYGLVPNLLIIPDPEASLSGSSVEFEVNGSPVNQTTRFGSGTINAVDLVIQENTKNTMNTGLQTISVASSSSSAGDTGSSSTPLYYGDVEKLAHATSSKIGAVYKDYRYDILHLNKEHARQYHTVNPSYGSSRILGTVAGILVIAILVWVYYQNYRHRDKDDLHL